MKQREGFASNFGFIMAAAGSAVGLGNIWRFPYLVGENGGGAFVFIYLACVVLVGLPLLILEVSIGRNSQQSIVGVFRQMNAKGIFKFNGFFTVFLSFAILSYYVVVAGWCLGYFLMTLANMKMAFQDFLANPKYVIALLLAFSLLTAWIVQAGVSKGIEKASKLMMPLLFLILLILAGYSLSLSGAKAGISYYLTPDFSKINTKVFVEALGQAFLSLSIGMGSMITYGSYMQKKSSIIKSCAWIASMDTFIALLAGFVIFPAVFSFGQNPQAGTQLVFQTLPSIFANLPFGKWLELAFFLLLTVAALTSSISLLEGVVGNVVETTRLSRKKATWILSIFAILLGIPSALSTGAVSALTNFHAFGQKGFLDVMNFAFGTVGIIVSALLTTIFVVWFKPIQNIFQETEIVQKHWQKIFLVLWKWVIPCCILVVLWAQFF